MSMRSYLLSGAKEFAIDLSENEITAIEIYGAELLKWNSKINLTAIVADKEVAIKHFVDSLILKKYLGNTRRLLDIGSGAGFPAIPLKIVLPELDIVTVDAVAKKIHFQKNVARLLGFNGFKPIHSRVEVLAKNIGERFDTIVTRAFSDIGMFIKLAYPLLTKDGQMIAMKGPDSENELKEINKCVNPDLFEIRQLDEYELPFGCGKRCLVAIRQKII